jgi:DNA-binding response OmpR family regulator
MSPVASILIIEDEANLRQTMQMALETEGYDVETAADGAEGLRRFGDKEGWSLVFLDQRMPGMEGVEVLRRIRDLDTTVPIVLITAYGSIDLEKDALASGASAFLQKPFPPAEVRRVAREMLARE